MSTADSLQLRESEIQDLKAKIDQLHCELKTATAEKIQSAQYGLVLLDEKEELQRRYNELEIKFDSKSKDFEDLKEALERLQTIQRVSTTSEIEQEEQLLLENAKKEEKFISTVIDLSKELKLIKSELQNVKDDREKCFQENAKLMDQKEITEKERRTIIDELRESKQRESRLHSDINELEEENISLQKQVSILKSSQVDFESFKLEIQRLQGEIEILQTQIEECTKLKCIAEKQTQEALETLQLEREQKYAIKKELDKKMSSETYLNINNFVGFSGLKLDLNEETENFDAVIDENNALRKFENEFFNSESYITQPPSLEGSLFSEVHINEIKKFERMLEESDNQKHQLTQRLNETQNLLEKSREELKNKTMRIDKIFKELSDMNLDDISSMEHNDPDLTNLKQLIKSKISDIDLNGYKIEIEKLQSSIDDYENKFKQYENDCEVLAKIINEFYSNQNQTYDEMSFVSEELAALYHHICLINNVTPDRVILDHLKPNFEKATVIDQSKEKLTKVYTVFDDIKLIECQNLLETIKDQIKVLRSAIDKAIENGNFRSSNISKDFILDQQPTSLVSAQDIDDLQDQIVRLKSLLSTKREQIASLRTVLKTNKQTAEVALANLKSKYETEKAVVTETMTKLRNELKALKEDAATFASLRSMFAARCEEYVSQIDELQSKFKASEEEKKTLNSLLRIAIQQKLSLTEKLEELEMDKERQNIGKTHNESRRSAKLNVKSLNQRLMPKISSHHNNNNSNKANNNSSPRINKFDYFQ
ncbi:Protein bicaudal D [Sarcoptes scabiei]|uniref:Protein bicaudal D n=1 Tax=Sarcoptes scabiei TaxID=52283 RepID=A0A834R5Y7_SARSC|nr:Protein bicaudal D [Sarcoptes scabiei]